MAWRNIIITMIITFASTGLIQAQTVNVDNGQASMTLSLDGGVIERLELKSLDLNPIHSSYGHFICFDRWGPSSEEDLAAGIPKHGNASKIMWNLEANMEFRERQFLTQMSCRLPIVNLGIRRKITTSPNTGIFKVEETITNYNDSIKVFNMVQHPTIGKPFLDTSTIINASVTKGFSQAGTIPPAQDDILTWPKAIVNGDSIDLRKLSNDHNWSHAVVSFTVRNDIEYSWVTACNPSLNLLVGYLWDVDEYLWLNLWLHLRDSEPFARGLEFGTTGLHQTLPELISVKEIFGIALYDSLFPGDSISKTYYNFLCEIPADYKGVASVSMEEDFIYIDEIGEDHMNDVALPISGDIIGISKGVPATSVLKVYPNPIDMEATICYHQNQRSYVLLQVFDANGRLAQTLVDEIQGKGEYQLNYRKPVNQSGMQILVLRTSQGVVTEKILHTF